MIVEVLGEIFMPKFMAQIINNGVQHQNVGYIVTMGLVMLGTAVLMMLGGIGGSYFGAKASINFGADVRHDVFSKVQKFSFSNIDKFSTASLVTRLTNDVTQMQNFINMLLRMCLRSPGMLIGALIMAININAKLALILAVIMPVMVVTMVFVLKKGFPRFGIMQTKIDGLNTSIQENLTNVRVVKSFVREEYQNEKFQEANRDLKKAGLSAMNVVILTMPLMNFFMNFTSLAVV